MCIHCQNFISIKVAVQELGGGGLLNPPPPLLGQGESKKHLGRARVKVSENVKLIEYLLFGHHGTVIVQ